MKRNELIKLRELVNQEVEKRNRILKLLENELVKEYLELSKIEIKQLDSNNVREILNQILTDFNITKTNGIYVCTQASYLDCSICYQDTSYYIKNTKIDAAYADDKTYVDIESGKTIQATKKENYHNGPLIKEFEKDNIVLNPYNTPRNKNRYDKVRIDFFENALKYGQAKSKQKILKKYPRL